MVKVVRVMPIPAACVMTLVLLLSTIPQIPNVWADKTKGTIGDDVLDGTPDDDVLKGLSGDDRISGNGGDDKIFGGKGDDTLTGGPGADVFNCGPGSDRITDFSPQEGDTKRRNCELAPEFPTLSTDEVEELTKDAISNSDYGIIVRFVRSDDGYLGGGVPPVGPGGEEPPPDPNALLLSSDVTIWQRNIILCGPDGICIEDGHGEGLIGGSPDDPGLYKFYPLNEVSWDLGDTVDIWILVSELAPNGEPVESSQWIDLGYVEIEECTSEILRA